MFDELSAGGIPAGSLIYISTDPSFESERILYQFCSERKTYYFTTERNPGRIEDEMREAGVNSDNIVVIDLRETLDKGKEIISAVKDAEMDFNIIIDTFLPFLRDYPFIKALSELCIDKESLCFLCVPKNSCSEELSSRLSYICDVFFDIRVERVGNEIVASFAVPKIRCGSPLMRYVRLKIIPGGVEIDTSRDIV